MLRLCGIGDRWMNEHGATVKLYWQVKTEVLVEKYVSLSFCPSQIPHGLVWNWKRASAVRGRRLIRSVLPTQLPMMRSLDGNSRTEYCSVIPYELTNHSVVTSYWMQLLAAPVLFFHYTLVTLLDVGRDSIVGIATRYGLDGAGIERRSQWPCGLRRGSSAARLLGSWVRIPPGAWMFVLCLL